MEVPTIDVTVNCSAGYICGGGSDTAAPTAIDPNKPNRQCPKVLYQTNLHHCFSANFYTLRKVLFTVSL